MAQQKTSPNDVPLYLFHMGQNAKAYEFFGAHRNDENSVVFRVWAPHAQAVSVVGDFNGWNTEANYMYRLDDNSSWESIIENINVIYFIQILNNISTVLECIIVVLDQLQLS